MRIALKNSLNQFFAKGTFDQVCHNLEKSIQSIDENFVSP